MKRSHVAPLVRRHFFIIRKVCTLPVSMCDISALPAICPGGHVIKRTGISGRKFQNLARLHAVDSFLVLRIGIGQIRPSHFSSTSDLIRVIPGSPLVDYLMHNRNTRNLCYGSQTPEQIHRLEDGAICSGRTFGRKKRSATAASTGFPFPSTSGSS